MTIRSLIMCMLFSFFLGGMVHAQKVSLDETDTQANVKASYLFQISKYTDWPEATKQGSFVIAIAENESLYNILVEKYANKPIGRQLLKIELLNSPDDLDGNEQILYIHPGSDKVEAYINKAKKKPVIISSELENGLDRGIHLNFKKIEGIIRFEINDTDSQKNGVLFSDKLKGWAIKLK